MLLNRIHFIFCASLFTFFFSCDTAPYPQGERIYKSQCANCHMEKGQGLGTLIPPIKESDYYLSHYDELACLITNGLSDTIMVNGIEYQEIMPPARKLTEAELSNLINYMNSQWYPLKEEVNLRSIRESLETCDKDQVY